MKKFKAILIAVLAVLPAIYTAVAVFFILPETVAAHYNIHGQVDRYGSKYEALLFPAIILGIALFFFIIRKVAKIASTDDNAARNLDILDTAILLIFVLFNVVCVFLLTIMKNPSVMQNDTGMLFIILCSAMGILFILLGNIMPKTRRNAMIGMRMKFCMDTDEHWYIANRAGGIALVLAGVCTIAGGLIFRSSVSIFVMVISLIVFLTVASIYSYGIIKKK